VERFDRTAAKKTRSLTRPKDRGKAARRMRQGGFLMAKVHQLSGRIFARMLKEHGIRRINPAQGRILFVLWQKDGIPIVELSRRTGLEKSTLTSMLDRLEKNGFVERVPSKSDRRKIIIRRTEKDKSFQERYQTVSDEMNVVFYRGMRDAVVDDFERKLETILQNLMQEEKNHE
jgi:DNA-binding MarR family transcriptional regulator